MKHFKYYDIRMHDYSLSGARNDSQYLLKKYIAPKEFEKKPYLNTLSYSLVSLAFRSYYSIRNYLVTDNVINNCEGIVE